MIGRQRAVVGMLTLCFGENHILPYKSELALVLSYDIKLWPILIFLVLFTPIGLVSLDIKNKAPLDKICFHNLFSSFSCSQYFPFLIISCAVATCGLRFQYPIIVIQQRALARPILETHCLFPTTMPKTFSFSLSLSVVLLVLFSLIIRSTLLHYV